MDLGSDANQSPGSKWRWDKDADDRVVSAHDARQTQSVLFQMAVPAAVGLVMRHGLHQAMAGTALLGFSVLLGATALWCTPAYVAWQRVAAILGRATAAGVTWVLIIPCFYGLFTAGRLLLLVTRQDPLHRRCPSPDTTYWTPKPKAEAVGHYDHQY